MRATLNHIDHWYDLAGSNGSPVLLVMGFGFSGSAWRPQVEGLQQSHRVAFYDNRGVAQSQPGPGTYALRDLASDAVALLDHLSWPDAHVVGVSMGGMIAQELALRHRHRVRSLTLIATHAGGRVRTLPTAEGLKLFLRANSASGDARLETLMSLLYPPGHAPEASAVRALYTGGLSAPPKKRTVLKQLAAVLQHDTRSRLHQLSGLPTLVLKPERDILVRPEHSDRIHKAIPGSTLRSFPEAGHGLTAQCASEVNQCLLTHFAAAD